MRQRYKTDIESLMRNALKSNRIDFCEEFPIRGKYGYSLDFAIVDLKIDIECDGEHYHKIGNSHDRKRNWVLRNNGWIILRFRGKEIKENINICIAKIKDTIKRRLKEKDEDKNKSKGNCSVNNA